MGRIAFYPIAVGLIVAWIYLLFVVRKKRLAQRPLKVLKALLLVAGISFAVFIANLVVQLARFGSSEEGAVVFFIALFSVALFFIGTIGGLVVFLKGPRETTQ